MENSDIGLFILAFVAITGMLISVFERRVNKPGTPREKNQTTKLERRS